MPFVKVTEHESMRKPTLMEIKTTLAILDLYPIPINELRDDMYDDFIRVLENKRHSLEQDLMGITALLTRLAGL
jgi:hypothetical protein